MTGERDVEDTATTESGGERRRTPKRATIRANAVCAGV